MPHNFSSQAEKQMAIINPKTLCKAWFAIKDFINKDNDTKKASQLHTLIC